MTKSEDIRNGIHSEWENNIREYINKKQKMHKSQYV